jgi:FkbM family methyltransferase
VNYSTVIDGLGRLPVLGQMLRKMARIYPEGSVTRIRSGPLRGRLWYRSHRHVNAYWVGTYELPVQQCLMRELRDGGVFFDIGANAGFFSLLAAGCVGPEGRVVAFDPLPVNQKVIERQFSLNQIQNGVLVPTAVSDAVGEVVLCEGASTATAYVEENLGQQGILVKCTSLDEFCKTGPIPDFVKLDVEGAEVKCLRGAAGLLRNGRLPKFLIEWHGADLARKGTRFLQSFGYRFQDLQGCEVEEGVFAHHVLALPAANAKGGRPAARVATRQHAVHQADTRPGEDRGPRVRT